MRIQPLGFSLVVTLLLGTAACAKNAGQETSSSEMKATACVTSKPVNADELAIRGAAGAGPGDVVRYSLNENLACAPGQTVSWKSLNSKAAGDGAVFTASFRRPGAYVVAAQVQAAGQPTLTEVSYKTVVSAAVAVSGPQVGMAFVENTFALVVPTDASVLSAAWTFGDQTPAGSGLSVKHAFMDVGTYSLNVVVTLVTGEVQNLRHSIQIIPVREGFECVNQLAVSGATSVPVATPAALSVYLPSCLTTRVTSLKWTFGDGGVGADQSVQHTYAAVGAYPVVVGLYSAGATTPFVTLTTNMNITAADVGVGPVEEDRNQCASLGLTRQITGEIYTKELACGVGGKRVNSYRDLIEQSCQKPADLRVWTEVSRAAEVVNEGACEGQSCELATAAGLVTIPHGGSKSFFSSALPNGRCSEVTEVRVCANGKLSGSATALTCQSGCAGIGPHGSTLENQVTGQQTAPKTCAFGETGILDVFQTLATKTCVDGQVTVGGSRAGNLLLAGACPVYHLGGGETYGACSADCGGEQRRVFECRNAAGGTVGPERCVGQVAPVVIRACDGNPAAVARTDTNVTTEEGGQSKTCPAKQIGIVVQNRERIETIQYACVDHQVRAQTPTVTYGAWTSQEFCRDYVAYRCSQDSLSNDDSVGRYQWMLKCRDQVPAIDAFLTQFEDYRAGTDQKPYLLYNHRMVYATFMNRASSPEKTWKAPVKASASCAVPATAYIASVCTASCATPEQQILTENSDRKLTYAPIGTAWQRQFRAVATLAGGSLDSKKVTATAVDQWVTELVDGTHDVLNFRMKSGGVLRLTPNHPVVTVDGQVKLANTFAVGESLVKLGGASDPIVGIDRQIHEGKVYNVFVKNSDPRRNVVVTNGYLNGTAYFQNEGATEVNKHLFRANLVAGAVK